MFDVKFKKINKIFRRDSSGRFCSNHSCGWVGLLVFFMVLNLTVIVFSTYLYYKIDKGEVFVANDQAGGNKKFVRINKEELDEIIYNFNSKATLFKELKSKKSLGIIDPSL